MYAYMYAACEKSSVLRRLMLVGCTYCVNNYLYICLVDVFVKRPKPCDLIVIPYSLSLSNSPSPTNKYLNSKKEKKSDPTRPAAVYTPFYRKQRKRSTNNTNRYPTKRKSKSTRESRFLCAINRTRSRTAPKTT